MKLTVVEHKAVRAYKHGGVEEVVSFALDEAIGNEDGVLTGEPCP